MSMKKLSPMIILTTNDTNEYERQAYRQPIFFAIIRVTLGHETHIERVKEQYQSVQPLPGEGSAMPNLSRRASMVLRGKVGHTV